MNKNIVPGLLALTAASVFQGAHAQSMAIAWDLFVFPGSDQSVEQQYADEEACYSRSREITGVDPANPMAGVSVEYVDPGGQGLSAAEGAVRGASRAAIIGNLADEDAGEYALAGAVIGSVRGARRREEQVRQQHSQARADAEAEGQKRLETFKRAFTACMQSKHYTVN